MTKLEITEKSNKYKFQVIDCDKSINHYNSSIHCFETLRAYMNHSKNKAIENRKTCGIVATISIVASAIFAFFALPLSLAFLIASIITAERLYFFHKVVGKFEKCTSILDKTINQLQTKQNNYISQRSYCIEEIIKLEKVIPSQIKEEEIAKPDEYVYAEVKSVL